jgi:hypothetical protein
MVWLAKWIRENRGRRTGADHHRPHRAGRADREGVLGVNEAICRTKSGADLINKLNGTDRIVDVLAGPQVWRQG